jgi:copper chaperone CopZ
MKVTKVVKELHGVKKALVSPDMKELTVTGSQDMDPDAVVVAVTEAGYVAEKSG